MSENYFALQPIEPKIIVWDNWPTTSAKYYPEAQHAIGLPHRKDIDLSKGTYVQIRPEFRLFREDKTHVLSIVVEMPFYIHFLKGILPTKELLFEVTKTAHSAFQDEFQIKTSKPLISYWIFQDDIVLDGIVRAMKQSDWL